MASPTKSTGSLLNEVPIDSPLGHRISVVGGGGKSTLSSALSRKLGLPYIELDALFWKPNWQESTAEELQEKVGAAVEAAPDGWVMDGHYWSRLGDMTLKQADTVVFLDLPWRVMFWRMLIRSFKRAWDKNKICGDNTESWRMMFSRDALWLYWVTHRRDIINRQARMATLLPASTPVIHLTSAAEQNRFFEIHDLQTPA